LSEPKSILASIGAANCEAGLPGKSDICNVHVFISSGCSVLLPACILYCVMFVYFVRSAAPFILGLPGWGRVVVRRLLQFDGRYR
jgi:hypothetical protein